MFGLHRFKLHRHVVDGTVKFVWFRQIFGLLRIRFIQVSLYIQSVISKINERFQPEQLDLLQGLNKMLNPKCMQNNCKQNFVRHESANPILWYKAKCELGNNCIVFEVLPPYIVGFTIEN